MLPKDPAILISILNMKLRDFYPSFTALCDDLDEDPEELQAIMLRSGYIYSQETNSFVRNL